MAVQFLIHLEPATGGGLVWWAETAAVPGLSVVADTLDELRVLAREAAVQHLGPDARFQVAFDLAAEPPSTTGEPAVTSGDLPTGPETAGSEARRLEPRKILTPA